MHIGPEQIAVPVIVWALTAALGFVAGRVGKLAASQRRAERKADEAERLRMEALCAGMRSLLRNELVKTHRDVMRDGGCTLLDKEIAERNYKAYHGLDGNGTGTAMFEEIMAAPILDDLKIGGTK